MNYIVEIATSDFLTTKSAVEGGADRIELCANLAEGGTTPSYAHIKKCREAFDIALFPIIRPRGGDFLYTKDEFEIMKNDIKLCNELGCEGIVIGLLNMDGTIDMTRTSELIELAYPMDVTFHRAFDRCKDPFAALEELIEIGCQRILTSGQKPTVSEGMDMIAELNKKADDRIIIMPGSGLRKDNIKTLAEKTGCTEFHSSLRGKAKSPMQFIHPAFANSEESYSNNEISPDEVRALRNALN
ncbi:MAG TPA: copper homeostasis protein CutC [Chitinophagaceae bacterium]|jgi:copper homeostasis protein|nr:copper homeostasis protein CutC [Chitinophagaceae bacterium]